jgi:phytoene desaturase
MINKKVLITGSGLGALTAALRLHRRGYSVTLVEKYKQAGGRLNQIKKDGFTFDMGPTFFSMTYEFAEFIKDAQIEPPFVFRELDILYTVSFRGSSRKFVIYKDIDKLAHEFEDIEPDFKEKMTRFLNSGGQFFHSVENKILKRNFDSIWEYMLAMTTVPPRYAPRLWRTVWQEMEHYFQSREVKEIFSLVAFFLGATPFDTPAIYTLLSYTELVHDGYHNVQGGMYKIVEGLCKELEKKGIDIHYNTEITGFVQKDGRVTAFTDQNGKYWDADIFLVNSDAAYFRHKVFGRAAFTEAKLDKMQWTLAPFTMYLGINTRMEHVPLHNYFLGTNFDEYAQKIFKNSITLDKPYYYVNVVSRSDPDSAPEGHEALFVLCPVPDLRFKPNWDDKDRVADTIIADLSQQMGFDLAAHIVSKTIMTPIDWGCTFNLYKGSGLGLGHNLSQIGPFRPKNVDEVYKNVFYVGASTIPGTGLPMAVISSKLAVEQIEKKYGLIHA